MQLAQACHAAVGACLEEPDWFPDWYEASNNLVVLGVPSQGALLHLATRADEVNVGSLLFTEPDLNDEPTALALQPVDAAARLTTDLPLAGKELEPVN